MNYTLKIAVIGGRGKVGRFIADYALKRGYQVRMLVRSINLQTTSNEHIEVVEGDARDKDVIANLIQGCNVVINTLGQPAKGKAVSYPLSCNDGRQKERTRNFS
ncbi:putative NADH-flavin reductase [Paenibacillus anaericanus]|uniref:NAD(P)-dependent oxidoreductase n=1 Tax=Paenibacillus anaericanus TaxID=170367 RepID=UPI002784A709|nr:NAD(P)H-binding protein [Paenibacillus anaericanus]MDQ0089738.1 putative NADH-flavin reductase [Paenibacillus anaericanus]